jgi:hypothetical protein
MYSELGRHKAISGAEPTDLAVPRSWHRSKTEQLVLSLF